VPLRATAIRQVVLNLVLNACQATPRDSWVGVSIAEISETVVLRVEDAGQGMPPAAEAMLTGSADRPAPIGKGTGLGLWMTNRLVRELVGNIAVERKAECGTRVTIAVPVKRTVELSDVA
jgi:signal transduction histidine kinase